MEEEAPPGVARGLPCPLLQISPFPEGSESEGNEKVPEDFNLEDLPELGPEVDCFLWGPVKGSDEENMKISSPKPLIEGFEKWLT